MNYSINEQLLSFDRVLLRGDEVPALVKDSNGRYILQFYAPNAREVSFVIQEIERKCIKGSDGVWRTEYPLKTAMNFVQLRIDGVDVLTHLLPISYGYSKPYNYVALDTEEKMCEIRNIPHGCVRREYFFSKVTGEWDSCMVYTPYCYDTEVDKVFPILYLQHGHGENEVSWIASGKVNFIMDNLIAEGKAVPFVIVMSNGMVQTQDDKHGRYVDFRLFERKLFEDIIPFAESRFRAGGSRTMRAMAGLSMGSLQTCICGFTHPEVFYALGVFSGFVSDIITGSPLDVPDRGPGDNSHLEILNDSKAFARYFPVFFRAMGDKDPFWCYFEKDDKMLAEKGIQHIRKVYDGYHDWNVWRQCIYDFAQMIFK